MAWTPERRARQAELMRATRPWEHSATPERRARQADLIRDARPWELSTGPTSDLGKAVSSRNAWKGGRRPLSRRRIAALRVVEDLWRRGATFDEMRERMEQHPLVRETLLLTRDRGGGVAGKLP